MNISLIYIFFLQYNLLLLMKCSAVYMTTIYIMNIKHETDLVNL